MSRNSLGLQHVKNSGLMLMCEECGMWRLLYATRMLSAKEKRVVEASLDGLSFSCGSQLNEVDFDLPEDLFCPLSLSETCSAVTL